MHNLDVTWFYVLNSLPERIAGHDMPLLSVLNGISIFCAEYLLYMILAAIIVMFALSCGPSTRINERHRIWKMLGVAVLGGIIARFVVKEIIVIWYHRARPYLVLSHVHKLTGTTVSDNYQSFPSGHAIFCFALAAGLYTFHKKIGSWYYAAAIIISISRVVVGVHYPSDIIGGAFLGMVVGWGTARVSRRVHVE